MDQLRYLAESYFHQDYDLDADTPLDLIREFRESEPASDVAELVADVQRLLRVSDEAVLRETWINHFRASYEPDRDGMSYREWFERVLEVLREPR